MTLFRCPICAAPLRREGDPPAKGGALRCPEGHSFDLSREGYAYLLPPNRKHSKIPGDDREMVAARSAFLDKGYYLPLRSALEEQALELTAGLPAPVVVDSGCGEGWYTAGIFRALAEAGRRPVLAGVDISKFALRRAARRLPEGQFAVASSYRLPLPNGCAHLLLDIFSPLAVSEFARVLGPGGHFIYVVPSARHLWQMKQVLYPQDILALFRMTPYAWKTPKEGVERLKRLDRLETEIGFDLHLYQKQERDVTGGGGAPPERRKP